MAGVHGAADAERNIRGFASKFYSEHDSQMRRARSRSGFYLPAFPAAGACRCRRESGASDA
ncbi:hypothetical protein [Pseudomonas fluorescens]|uniref:hypothetical protein n=1 Tax=Pseudomonas fluorescens TaxID=294 RepID=UPI003D31E77D